MLLLQLITYEALGLCKAGEAHKLVERGDNTVCYQKPSVRLANRFLKSTAANMLSTPAAALKQRVILSVPPVLACTFTLPVRYVLFHSFHPLYSLLAQTNFATGQDLCKPQVSSIRLITGESMA